jgi:non-canonical (house-cleaning) NTP pyrophosphatase
MNHIATGTTNPGKIKAIELSFPKIWPEKSWQVTGVKVASGVSRPAS